MELDLPFSTVPWWVEVVWLYTPVLINYWLYVTLGGHETLGEAALYSFGNPPNKRTTVSRQFSNNYEDKSFSDRLLMGITVSNIVAMSNG